MEIERASSHLASESFTSGSLRNARCPKGDDITALAALDLACRVDRVAAGLQSIGVARGDRGGLCLPNTPFFVIRYLAVLKIGAVVVNYNPLYVERELKHRIRDSGTSVMVVIDVAEIHRKVAAAAKRTGLRHVVVCALAEALPPMKAALYRVLKRRENLTRVPSDGLHVKFDVSALAVIKLMQRLRVAGARHRARSSHAHPPSHGRRTNTIALGQCYHALLTALDRATDRLCRSGRARAQAPWQFPEGLGL